MVADVLLIGAGCAGAMAAQTLVESGRSVLLVDVGFPPADDAASVPDIDFLDVRTQDPDQSRFLIGEAASGVQWGAASKGEHITPPRRHLMHRVDELLPVRADGFEPVESLGYGGLGIGWGLGCWQFSRAELKAAGLDVNEMRTAYREVNRRIGISAELDDLGGRVLDDQDEYQPASRIDRNHTMLLGRYDRRRTWFQRNRLSVGRAPLALLTEPLGDREPHHYRDLDFYADIGRSTFRPGMVIDRLRREGRLDYRGGLLALTFRELDASVELTCADVDSGERVTVAGRQLVLAAGAIGSARIVLRSVPGIGELPLLCSPYSVIPCVQPRLLGADVERGALSVSQLSMLHDANGDERDVALASLYSYRSLMLFRVLRQAPVAMPQARRLLRWMTPGMLACGVFTPDSPGAGKRLSLEASNDSISGDRLVASWSESSPGSRERIFKKALRRLGALPLRVVQMPPGASIHYGGTLPYSSAPAPGRLDSDGRLHGTSRVFVADGSGFRFLPGRGPTWSIMANAHRTARATIGHES